MDILIFVYFFIVGAAFGSFSLVLAWRMHDGRDWVKGRSACEECGHELSALDMVPILSWLFLRGKCRYCKKPFSKQLLFAELLLGTILASSYAFWPFSLNSVLEYLLFVIWLLICVLLSALFWYDLRWYLLPNKLVYPLLGLSVVFSVLRGFIVDFSFIEVVVLPILAAALLSGLFYAMFTVSKGKWIGFGDVRLAVPLGLILANPINAWLMLFFASILGIVATLPGIVSGKTKLQSKIPFGPLLIVASIIVFLGGEKIVNWYTQLIGL